MGKFRGPQVIKINEFLFITNGHSEKALKMVLAD